jgi:hypothetical protein
MLGFVTIMCSLLTEGINSFGERGTTQVALRQQHDHQAIKATTVGMRSYEYDMTNSCADSGV